MKRRGIKTLFEWGEENRGTRSPGSESRAQGEGSARESGAEHVSRQVLSVSAFSTLVSGLLSVPSLTDVCVRGEARNVKRSGGHLYFSLCEFGEQEAVVSCKMWRSSVGRLSFPLEDGIAVFAYGSVQCYAPHGTYSLIITDMQADGAGEKYLLLERWKRELSEEGVFSHQRKRALPRYPTRVGVVTSPTGAVFHDIKNIIANRFPLELVLSPTSVQGSDAHREIAAAIFRLEDFVDIIIVCRGGGSFEDLFAFQHPDVVRAIAAAPVPVISAIGHEVDVTLADLAADVRASTPSHAAELAVPDRSSEILLLREYKKRFFQAVLSRLEYAFESLNEARERFLPSVLLRGVMRRQEQLADQTERMERAVLIRYDSARRDLVSVSAEMKAYHPAIHFSRQIKERQAMLLAVHDHFHGCFANQISAHRAELDHLLSLFKAHDPRAPFAKGYCIARGTGGSLIRSVGEMEVGSDIMVVCVDGTATATVSSIDKTRVIYE
ncbi:MAG: exodeoxyribonuclease VII large subunit [Methanomicrobiales archaeon]|jgi:exodeoxyribonuclease VII large subunit|nr:exodeoxyribonuclease VII large subunit [Methanomicrobiales archaeon]